MTEISVAEVEARSGVEKEPGETLAEYLRRVGARTDLPADDVEAVVTALQRQQFAGETVTAEDADAPIEPFLEAADDLGDDAGDPDGDAAGGDDPDTADDEGEDDGGTEAPAGTAVSGSAAATDDGPEEDPMTFYRSVAVLGVVVLLAGGVIGSAVLLGTDLGPDDDGPEMAGDADALDDAANGTGDGSGDGESGGSDDGNGTEVTANGSGTDGTATNGTDEEAASDDTADDGNTSGGDETGNDTADPGENGTEGDDENDTQPIGFDGETTDDDTDAGNDSETDENDTDEGDTDSDGGTDGDDNDSDGEPVGFDEDGDGTEDDDETEDAGGEEGTDDPGAVDSAPEATGSLEVTDRAAPGDDPADEYVELTNVGDAPLDMSGWTVRDREGGAVDTHGIEPLAFPEGFVLEPGESVRLVTGDGEDTADTIYWGQDRQYWRSAGDVVIVRDADGETVLRHPYGDQG